jgi:hypothetical protein
MTGPSFLLVPGSRNSIRALTIPITYRLLNIRHPRVYLNEIKGVPRVNLPTTITSEYRTRGAADTLHILTYWYNLVAVCASSAEIIATKWADVTPKGTPVTIVGA